MVPGPPRRPSCQGCERPAAACWCAFVRPVRTVHRVVVLQHPREVREPFGTVRVLRRALPGIVVRVGIDFTADAELAAMCRDPERRALLLFPGPGGTPFQQGPAEVRTVVALDGRWSHARTLLAANPWLHALPRLALTPERPSRYALRQQPAEGCVSTIEAVAEALAVLDGDPGLRDMLLAPFDAMVGLQLACAHAGTSRVLDDRALLERSGYLARTPSGVNVRGDIDEEA
jgi:DTW domain-containing protein